ncbi:MAG TPA: LysM peptidoglycan-binding domain-containing protein [Lachnospiraceae bacterium]|nr:LysM peptidoglycan-binding domain-containing protein [Lachnospiraceae bacterium]
MIQSIYSSDDLDGKESDQNSSAFKMPKNIRQVGQVDSVKKIYAEDYVMTYIKQLAKKPYTSEKMAVLLGQYIKAEGGRHIFINGAVEIIENSNGDGTVFSNEVWTEIYECIKKYFSNVEIVGWYITRSDGPFDVDEHITQMHLDNFAGQDKTLLVYDSVEKEEAFYFFDKGKLKKQNGYYIYYDRNEEMQNYMVENRVNNNSTDAGYEDRATKKIRQVLESKNETNKGKSIAPLVYTASSLLAVVVLVIGATMVHNYDKMKDIEDSLSVISDNISETDETDAVTQVETVPSSISTIKNEDVSDSEAVDSTVTDEANSDSEGTDNEVTTTNTESTDAQENGNDSSIAKDTDKVEDSTATEDTGKDSVKEGEQKETQTKEDTADTKKDSDTGSKKEDSKSNKSNDEATQTAANAAKKYTIKQGDTLASISLKAYGTIKGISIIQEANNIEDQDIIFAGQEIVIPKYK